MGIGVDVDVCLYVMCGVYMFPTSPPHWQRTSPSEILDVVSTLDYWASQCMAGHPVQVELCLSNLHLVPYLLMSVSVYCIDVCVYVMCGVYMFPTSPPHWQRNSPSEILDVVSTLD